MVTCNGGICFKLRRSEDARPFKAKFTRHRILIALLGMLLPIAAHGQIFVVQENAGVVAEYTISGALVNSSLISGLNMPRCLASDGKGHLFVLNMGNSTVGAYTTSGATINASLITLHPSFPGLISLASDGSENLYAGNVMFPFAIGKYTTSGATVNAQLLTLHGATSIAADGNGNLFIADEAPERLACIRTSGQTINPWLITGLHTPSVVVLDGNGQLFVANKRDRDDRRIHNLGGDHQRLAHFGFGQPVGPRAGWKRTSICVEPWHWRCIHGQHRGVYDIGQASERFAHWGIGLTLFVGGPDSRTIPEDIGDPWVDPGWCPLNPPASDVTRL